MVAARFNTVDSFDTHAKIPEFYRAVDEAARQGGNVSVISTGWDPGLFSMNRLLAEAILPQGKEYTFWGKASAKGTRTQSDGCRASKRAFNIRFPSAARSQAYAAGKSGIRDAGQA